MPKTGKIKKNIGILQISGINTKNTAKSLKTNPSMTESCLKLKNFMHLMNKI